METKLKILAFIIMASSVLWAHGAIVSLATFDFNDGFQGWEVTAENTYFKWETRQVAPEGDPKSFSRFDPSDVASLWMTVPQTSDKRTHAYALSPEIYLKSNPYLEFHVAFNPYYDDACRLLLQISADGFKTAETIWNSRSVSSPLSWQWHKIALPLDEFEGRDVRFRFVYTTGSNKALQDPGGYAGDFAIDNFILMAEDITDRPDDPSDPIEPGETLKATIISPSPFTSVGPDNLALPFLPPASPVRFSFESSRRVTLATWQFQGLASDPLEVTTVREFEPSVSFMHTGTTSVKLIIQDEEGNIATDSIEILVGIENVNGRIAEEENIIDITLEDGSRFPGSNTVGITAYAQWFSLPENAAAINGIYVNFPHIRLEDSVAALASIGVHLYGEHEGVPSALLASSYIMAEEIASRYEKTGSAAYFSFESPVALPLRTGDSNKGFFVVIDGIPVFSDKTSVNFEAFTTDSKETYALVKKYGVWTNANEICHLEKENVSFGLCPQVTYSLFSAESEEYHYKTDGKASIHDINVYSTLPLSFSNPADWVSITIGTTGDYMRTIHLETEDLPEGENYRSAFISVGSYFNEIGIYVEQDRFAGITSITSETPEWIVSDGILTVTNPGEGTTVSVVSPEGILYYSGVYSSPIDLSGCWHGLYIVTIDGKSHKVIL